MVNSDCCQYIKLQGVFAPVRGIRGRDLEPGNVIMWNFGYTSTVLRVTPSASGKTITMETRDDSTGKTYTRKTTPDRLFGLFLLRRP